MDGTILNSKGEVTPKTRETVIKAMQAGILVVPATGRVLEALPSKIKDIPGIRYFMTSNGAAIYESVNLKPIYTNLLPPEKALEVIKCLEDMHVFTEAYVNGRGYYEKYYYDRLDQYHVPEVFQKMYRDLAQPPVDSLVTLLEQNKMGVEKLVCVWLKEDERLEIIRRMKELGGLTISSALHDNVEINAEGASKGNGLLGLCKRLHILPDQVMAFGDGSNDLEMLKAAGIPVAMGNAIEPLKKAADFITLSNDEDGVAYAIEKFCFGNE